MINTHLTPTRTGLPEDGIRVYRSEATGRYVEHGEGKKAGWHVTHLDNDTMLDNDERVKCRIPTRKSEPSKW